MLVTLNVNVSLKLYALQVVAANIVHVFRVLLHKLRDFNSSNSAKSVFCVF